jgi:hypothetical protein
VPRTVYVRSIDRMCLLGAAASSVQVVAVASSIFARELVAAVYARTRVYDMEQRDRCPPACISIRTGCTSLFSGGGGMDSGVSGVGKTFFSRHVNQLIRANCKTYT